MNKNATILSEIMNAYLRWKSVNGPPRGYEIYHPSEFGGCLRKMQYRRYAERGLIEVSPQTHEAKTIRIFDTGHTMHDRWAKYWEHLGVLRGVWECKNPRCKMWDDAGVLDPSADMHAPPRVYGREEKLGVFKPDRCACGHDDFTYHEITIQNEDLNIKGHVDQILDFSRFTGRKFFKQGQSIKNVFFKEEDIPKSPVVCDMKTINYRSFDFLTQEPPFGYWVQLNIYMNILDLEYGVLYFENKNDSRTKIIKVDRDESLWEKIKEQIENMQWMASLDHPKLPPPRPPNLSNRECNYCEFKPMCSKSKIWEDPELNQKRLRFYGDFE